MNPSGPVHNASVKSILLFAGQGTSGLSALKCQAQVVSETPLGATLLLACYEAFHRELASLTSQELRLTGLSREDFDGCNTVLCPAQKYLWNPILSGTTLLLAQSLQYLSYIKQLHPKHPEKLFTDALDRTQVVLGFSSGLLAACVAATSNDIATYILHTIQAYQVAFWVGVHAQSYRVKVLSSVSASEFQNKSWTLVIMGASEDVIASEIDKFLEDLDSNVLSITAVFSKTRIAVSGHPDVLIRFEQRLRPLYTTHWTNVDSLYHSSDHLLTSQAVLTDLQKHNVCFPTYAMVKVPIYNSRTGQAINGNYVSTATLLECIIDLILVYPVCWNQVLYSVLEDLRFLNSSFMLINFGPSNGLFRELTLDLREILSDTRDLTNLSIPSISLPRHDPVAIVGMAINMPGAENIHELWDILQDGLNMASKIPEERFNIATYTSNEPGTRRMRASHGNFLEHVDNFDAAFFNISPREAMSMDPQQRLLLHAAYNALEDAGYTPDSTSTWSRETFGCYFGVATGDYVHNLQDNMDVYYSTGTLRAFLSGRISYIMKFGGPSLVIDTACSSSNVALYLGVRALMNNDCKACLVGGVNAILSPDMFLGLDHGHFLSPTGQCKTFDASADGYCRGEGVGVFVLKQLKDALIEHDQIYGIIRGAEVNQSGQAPSITYPHQSAQALLLQNLLHNANVLPAEINLVECHGTGTQAGDPNEVTALRTILAGSSSQRQQNNPLFFTSIKANIGHLEAASGAAGLAKILLMLKYKLIPQQISLKKLNPLIRPLENDNIIINQRNTHWPVPIPGCPRMAVLNNFGAAGSNSAVLIQENTHVLGDQISSPPYLFGLSAKSVKDLEKLSQKYIAWILNDSQKGHIYLGNLSYTMTARRLIHPYRFAFSASSIQEVVHNLGNMKTEVQCLSPHSIVYMFSGHGMHYPGMGKDLYKLFPVFQASIDNSENILKDYGFESILPLLLNNTVSNADDIRSSHTAVFALECGLAELWQSWGIVPHAVVGHSLGEYAALVIAGVLSKCDALIIVA
ncbi:unnamed protein product, partial [Mycena citricolor]